MLFDWLVVGQVVAVNPASVVRGPKHVVKRGKTPVPEEVEDESAPHGDDTKRRADPAEASEVAERLLLPYRIPIVILNACQSGKQTGDAETSLAARLMQAGSLPSSTSTISFRA